MARCSCPGGQCGCKIVSGSTSILVTGTGTTQDPFTVGLLASPITNLLAVTDSANIDLTLGGDGTIGNPYSLNAALIQGVDASAAMTSGGSASVSNVTGAQVLTAGATVATFTVVLPTSSISLNKEIAIVTTAAITTLTVSPGAGTTVAGAPTTLAANGFFRMRLIGTVWRRVG